ncbi:DNA polymerase IV [Natronorarus salvus]|uniref:DNA polymerase IV n=1 Tax=Natronorarus salvus TaxID=3117733 RepID=UPI002F268FDB
MAGDARLPGASTEERAVRIVIHADVDCFYAACERLREPALRGEPVVVGMGYESGETRGAVATASYEARAYGVESAQPITDALERLPRKVEAARDPDLDVSEAGFYRPVDMGYYKSVSEEIRAHLREAADVFREVSIDEAYLDVSTRTDWEGAEAFARDLTERIAADVGVTVSVGVAPNMSTAKVASDAEKPDGCVVVRPGEVEGFLAPIPIEELHGVGPVTARSLRDRGIETAGDLASADEADLASEFGERGRDLHRRARGEDDRAVTPRGRPKSLSRESAFETTEEYGFVAERVSELAAAVAERTRSEGAMYRTIGIKVVTPPFSVNTRERSLSGPVDDPSLVGQVAHDLLSEFEGERVRKVGVRVSNLEFSDDDQASLGAWGEESARSDGSSEDRSPPSTPGGQASLSDFE